MASHHHSHHHTTTTSCCCCTAASHQPPPPSPPSMDPLLQALASQILLQQSSQPHHHLHNQQNLYQDLNKHHHHHHKTKHFQHPSYQQQQRQDQQIPDIISSLVNRIDALESSLHHLSSSSSSLPSYHSCHSSSLRDAAARIIQTHFRAFLVRRSRTLRNLKDLALIKSRFNALKSSLSDKTHLDPDVLSRKAMALLLNLDSIQGGDPMIRDGKRAISRDLIRFLDFIDGVSVKKREISTKDVKNVRFVQKGNKSRVLGANCCRSFGDRDQREIMEKLRDRVQNIGECAKISEYEDEEVELEGFHQGSDDEQIGGVSICRKSAVSQVGNGVLLKRPGIQSRVKKNVSFKENGNVTRVFVSGNSASSIDGSVSTEVEEIGSFSKGDEGDDEDAHTESGGSDQTSDGEVNARRRNLGAEGDYEIVGSYQGQNGNLVSSAPVPVKMGSRADFMEKRLGVKESLRR